MGYTASESEKDKISLAVFFILWQDAGLVKSLAKGDDALKLIGDDPIVCCLERSGYPPWFFRGGTEYDERGGDADRGEDDNEI